MLTELARALPAALLFALPVTALGGLLLHRMRRRSVTAAMTTLALVPLVAALAGVVAVSGFMYTPQLAGTLAVVGVVAAVTVPVAALLGRRLRPRRAVAAGGPGGGAAGRGRPPRAGGVDEPRPALPDGGDPGHGRRAGRRGRAPARRGRRLPRARPAGDHPAGGHGRRPVPALPGHVGRPAARRSSRSRSARSSPTPSPPRRRPPRPPASRWSPTSRTAGRPWRAATPS